MIQKITETIMKEQKNRFKINYSLTYILRNIETDELPYFYTSYNNHLMLETALLISNRQELLDFLNSISEESFIENITRPHTKWKNFKHYLLHQSFARRARIPLPDFIMNNHGLANVSAEDNLCFFRCLAVFRSADHRGCNCAAKQLFYEYCTYFDVSEFSGVSLFDFVELENFYKINIVAYELENNKAKVIQRRRELYNETMKVQWNLAIRTPLYSYNSLFVQYVHTTFDSSFVRCSAIQIHTVIYRAKEDKLQQRSKTFVRVMSTTQCSVVTFFVGLAAYRAACKL